MGVTYIVNRIELKRMLTNLGVSDASIEGLLINLDKMHRHVNAVAFAGMLQKMGLKQSDITNVLRRIGVDDVTITDVFNMLDEEKITSTFGKVSELVLG